MVREKPRKYITVVSAEWRPQAFVRLGTAHDLKGHLHYLQSGSPVTLRYEYIAEMLYPASAIFGPFCEFVMSQPGVHAVRPSTRAPWFVWNEPFNVALESWLSMGLSRKLVREASAEMAVWGQLRPPGTTVKSGRRPAVPSGPANDSEPS